MKYLKPKQAKRPIPMQKVLEVKNHQKDKKDSKFSDTQLSENTRNSKRHHSGMVVHTFSPRSWKQRQVDLR